MAEKCPVNCIRLAVILGFFNIYGVQSKTENYTDNHDICNYRDQIFIPVDRGTELGNYCRIHPKADFILCSTVTNASLFGLRGRETTASFHAEAIPLPFGQEPYPDQSWQHVFFPMGPNHRPMLIFSFADLIEKGFQARVPMVEEVSPGTDKKTVSRVPLIDVELSSWYHSVGTLRGSTKSNSTYRMQVDNQFWDISITYDLGGVRTDGFGGMSGGSMGGFFLGVGHLGDTRNAVASNRGVEGKDKSGESKTQRKLPDLTMADFLAVCPRIKK